MADKIFIEFPDGSKKEFEAGITALDIASTISHGLNKQVVLADVNGVKISINTPITADAKILLYTFNDEEGRAVYNHTSAHIMAQAVMRLFPETKLTIGPAIHDGFYYDLDSPHRFTVDDFPLIEKEIQKIIQEDFPIVRKEIARQEAVEIYQKEKNPYKVEILEEIKDDTVTLYEQGEFFDLCRGPHLPSTGKIKVIKLLKLAGAYWRGDEKRPMLQRIYAAAFPSEKELKAYLQKLEEAEKRDHRRLGKELDLFSIQEDAGPGLIFWHPKGAAIRNTIENFWRDEHQRRGYDLVFSPHIANSQLWKISGHLENYHENMYAPIDVDGTDFIIKPMNCPFHILIYKNQIRSYRDLPYRWAELGTVYRYEKSGVLHGMLRVRGFTQDDAHIFCREDQLEEELTATIDLAFFMLKTFGFENFKVMLSTRPDKYVGDIAIWNKATEALKTALEENNVDFSIDEGGGAFYGPKIDIKLVDAIGRDWQGPTIQVDFNLPERFDMTFIGSDGQPHRPVMIHRAVLGSMERFVGTLIEHYGGKFPVWLSPVQARIIAVNDSHNDYVLKIQEQFRQALIRADVDISNNKLGYKIREAQMRKIPYMLIVGDKELESQSVNVRKRNGENLGAKSIDDVLDLLKEDIRKKI